MLRVAGLVSVLSLWENVTLSLTSTLPDRYQQSLSALGDLILLQPQNPFYSLRYAETAYTLGDYELAYHTYLRVLELCGKDGIIQYGGPGRRAAFGLKAVSLVRTQLNDIL